MVTCLVAISEIDSVNINKIYSMYKNNINNGISDSWDSYIVICIVICIQPGVK